MTFTKPPFNFGKEHSGHSDLSPPVPDDVALRHVIERMHDTITWLHAAGLTVAAEDAETLIRASQPRDEVEEVTVDELVKIMLNYGEYPNTSYHKLITGTMNRYPHGLKIKAGGG